MNVRDSCTVIIRIKLTAPLLCPGSNAHIFCSIPIRPPLDFHPKIPEGIPVALGAMASGTSLLLMQSHHLPGKTTHYQRLRPRSHVESTCFHVYTMPLYLLKGSCDASLDSAHLCIVQCPGEAPLSSACVLCPAFLGAPASLTCCPQIQSEQRMSLTSFCFHILLSYLDLIPLLRKLK